jgi:hypothetical protein
MKPLTGKCIQGYFLKNPSQSKGFSKKVFSTITTLCFFQKIFSWQMWQSVHHEEITAPLSPHTKP